MPVSIACPKCQTKYKLPEAALGKPIKCQKCGASFQTQATTGRKQPALSQPSEKANPQPSEKELARFGIDGPIKRQADIFSAPPPPPRANPLGNFVLEDPGFADVERARQEVREEEESGSDGMESILANPYARSGIKGGRKSNLPEIDLKPYGVARIGMWMVFISWASMLACMAFLYLVSWLVQLAPEFMGKLAQNPVFSILTLVILIVMFISLGIVVIGQVLCIFSPCKDEKLFAGLAVGALVASVVLPAVALFIGAIGTIGATAEGNEEVDQAVSAVIGMVMLIIIVAAYLLALSNMFFFITYFRRVGKNIRAKAVSDSAKQAMVTCIAAIAVGILCSIAAFVLLAIIKDKLDWLPMAMNLIGLVNAILGFAVMGTLIVMVKTAIRKTKAT